MNITNYAKSIEFSYPSPANRSRRVLKSQITDISKKRDGLSFVINLTSGGIDQPYIIVQFSDVVTPVTANIDDLITLLWTYINQGGGADYQDFVVTDIAGTNTFVCTNLTLSANCYAVVEGVDLMFGDFVSVVGNTITTTLTYPLNTRVRIFA
jgi:hypothetical protein